MGRSLPIEKLDMINYVAWSYKMHRYLLRHGYWSYVEGANNATLNSIQKDFPSWEQGVSRVLYCFTFCVSDQLLSYIWDAKMPKDVWENLKSIFTTSTTTRKLQLRQELSNVQPSDMSVTDYTSRIKEIDDSLASVNRIVEAEKMV